MSISTYHSSHHSSHTQSQCKTFDDAANMIQKSMSDTSIPIHSNNIVVHGSHDIPAEVIKQVEPPMKVETPMKVEKQKKIKHSKDRRCAGTVPLPEPWQMCCIGCVYVLSCCCCLNCCGLMKG